jgi:hypothetical protein
LAVVATWSAVILTEPAPSATSHGRLRDAKHPTIGPFEHSLPDASASILHRYVHIPSVGLGARETYRYLTTPQSGTPGLDMSRPETTRYLYVLPGQPGPVAYMDDDGVVDIRMTDRRGRPVAFYRAAEGEVPGKPVAHAFRNTGLLNPLDLPPWEYLDYQPWYQRVLEEDFLSGRRGLAGWNGGDYDHALFLPHWQPPSQRLAENGWSNGWTWALIIGGVVIAIVALPIGAAIAGAGFAAAGLTAAVAGAVMGGVGYGMLQPFGGVAGFMALSLGQQVVLGAATSAVSGFAGGFTGGTVAGLLAGQDLGQSLESGFESGVTAAKWASIIGCAAPVVATGLRGAGRSLRGALDDLALRRLASSAALREEILRVTYSKQFGANLISSGLVDPKELAERLTQLRARILEYGDNVRFSTVISYASNTKFCVARLAIGSRREGHIMHELGHVVEDMVEPGLFAREAAGMLSYSEIVAAENRAFIAQAGHGIPLMAHLSALDAKTGLLRVVAAGSAAFALYGAYTLWRNR